MQNKIGINKLNYKGFTLIELLVTLSVASILLSVAAPSYRGFVQDSLLVAQSNSFSSAIALAKSEAIKRSGRATGLYLQIRIAMAQPMRMSKFFRSVQPFLGEICCQDQSHGSHLQRMVFQWDQMTLFHYAIVVEQPIPK